MATIPAEEKPAPTANQDPGTSVAATRASRSPARPLPPRRPEKARAMVRHWKANERIPEETSMGAPTQTPMSFHAVPGPRAAVTTVSERLVHWAPSATGPMKNTSTVAPASIEAVTRVPTSAPAAISAGP